MKVITAYSCIVLFLFSPGRSNGQAPAGTPTWKTIITEMSRLSVASYTYDIAAQFPSGERDHVSGTAYINKGAKIIYSNSDAQTELYTGAWYYVANHRKKDLSIINISKNYTAAEKKKLEKHFLENSYGTEYIDSVVLKTGILQEFKVSGDTATFKLIFPKLSAQKHLDVVYDLKKKMPVRLHVEFFYPWEGDKRLKYKGTEQTVTCTNYSKSVDHYKYDINTYFTVANGKLRIKKYNKYVLKTEL